MTNQVNDMFSQEGENDMESIDTHSNCNFEGSSVSHKTSARYLEKVLQKNKF